MRKYILTIFILLVSTIVIIAADGKKYGDDIKLTEKTKISEILDKPDSFVGKKVLVEGLVVDVCATRGCWMEIAGDKQYESIRVKVDDGVIVFPMEAKGEKALVEGEVYSFNMEEKSNCSGKECTDKAKEEKKSEASSCCSKDKKVKTVYQIKATGAII